VSELVACAACGANLDPLVADSAVYPSSPGTDSLPRPERVLYCSACGLGIAWPRISDVELDAYYTQGGYWGTTGEPELLVPKLHPGHFALAQARWAFARAATPVASDKLSILDVGAGHGFFGMVASRDTSVALSRYVAVESDVHLRASLERSWPHFAPKGALTTVSDLSDAEGSFDLIVLSNILEHLNDPAGLLGEVAALLAVDGVVFVDVPCRDEQFKADVFPHVLFFDADALAGLLGSTGFEVLALTGFGRPRGRSPLRTQATRPIWMRLFERAYGLRRVLPETVPSSLFTWYFGADREEADGTWLRAVARVRCPEERE